MRGNLSDLYSQVSIVLSLFQCIYVGESQEARSWDWSTNPSKSQLINTLSKTFKYSQSRKCVLSKDLGFHLGFNFFLITSDNSQFITKDSTSAFKKFNTLIASTGTRHSSLALVKDINMSSASAISSTSQTPFFNKQLLHYQGPSNVNCDKDTGVEKQNSYSQRCLQFS